MRALPGGSVVTNLPSNAEDAGSIPGQGTKIPRVLGQPGPRATTTEPMCSGARTRHLERKPEDCKERSQGHNQGLL